MLFFILGLRESVRASLLSPIKEKKMQCVHSKASMVTVMIT